MTFVRTVLGDIEATQLGVTNAHEHLFIMGGLPVMKEPDFRLDSVEHAVTEVRSFLAAGGRSLLDAMPLDCGRSAARLMTVARETGAHVIACTGFHQRSFYDDLHWTHHYPVDQLTRLMIVEIEEGMDEHGCNGPIPARVEARAGAIKIATDYQRIAPVTEKLIEAAVAAHRATGAPIITHADQGTMGLEQAERLIRLGANPSHVAIGHLDRNPDLAYHLAIAATGVFLQYDTPGRINYQPESVVVALIAGMIEAGYGDRILLGGDTARRSSWRSHGGGPGIAYIVERFLPRLRAEGFAPAAIDALVVANPARAFSFAERVG
ncbi:MAG: phosphotriesterase family protein [Thermomicrobiales bacterium]